MSGQVLLSFDVEEFDMPLEYHFPISAEEQMRVGKAGLDILMPMIDSHSVASTLFTTANFAQYYPDAIREHAVKHEIASHTFYHSDFENEHLLQSRQVLAAISGQEIRGLRMPRMRKVAMTEVIKAGFSYDSSINPTWIPGRYNNLHLPRTVYQDQGMTRMPASVSPMRIPLFWLSFKNFPYSLFLAWTKNTLKKDGYVCLYFHPWEFVPIEAYGLPAYTRTDCGPKLLDKLDRLIKDLKAAGYRFNTMDNYLQQKSPA
jgi:peptidoglycan/xylan/chitin deacetylase (PgdA/CDA1 family)